MSLAIDVDRVAAVMVGNTWHEVADTSFVLDAYEYIEPHPDPDGDPFVHLYGGRETLVPATGFQFRDQATGALMFGPLTSIQAVRYETVL